MRSSLRRTAVPVALLALSMAGAACGSGSSSNSGSSGSGGSTTPGGSAGGNYEALSGTIAGSGSTFQAAFNEEAINGLKDKAPNLAISYSGGGSGKGKKDLADQLVDYAGTDSLVKEEEKAGFKGGAFFYIPTVAAPITVSYNVSGLDKLQLSPETTAKIFQATVTKWNDPAIAADNPGANLPDKAITVVRRADGSGTSETFTKYLKAAAPADFTIEPGSAPNWPASFQSAQGNGGVSQSIKSNDGAVGYVDFSDAKTAGLKMASIKNKAGTFIEPSVKATTAALGAAKVNDDLTYNALNTDAPDAYPIAASTYILVYQKPKDAKKAEALKGWLTYLLDVEGGQKLAPDVDFAPLPDSLRQKAQAQIAKIAAGA